MQTVENIISNLSIVTAYLFFANQVLFRNRNMDSPASPRMKVQLGLAFGVLGLLLLFFTVRTNSVILDYRQLAVILSALYGGVISSVITGIIIALMRLFAFGAITPLTWVAASSTLFVAIAVGILCDKTRMNYWRKWIYSLFICIGTSGTLFIIIMGSKAWTPMSIYIAMMIIGGLTTAYITQFLVQSKSHMLRLNKEATTDFLTGLNNHRTFDTVYNEFTHAAKHKGDSLSLVMVDLDFFKKVNDTYGHVNGDAVLHQLGTLLKTSARTFDTVSRNGGEEFSILMYDTPHEHALKIAERIRSTVEAYSFELVDGEKVTLTVSIGVATYPDSEITHLIDKADAALYEAKKTGRNKVCSAT